MAEAGRDAGVDAQLWIKYCEQNPGGRQYEERLLKECAVQGSTTGLLSTHPDD